MKNLLLFILIFLFTGSGSSLAQLSGIHNIGTDGDYPSLKAAFDDLMDKGVDGDVTFLITSDLTEPENVALGIDPGEFTITVRPAPATTPVVTFSQSLGNSVYNGALIIGLTEKDGGADELTLTRNIVFDGSNTEGGTTRDLTLQTAPDAGTANTFRFIGDTENVQIRNTNILWNQTGNAFNTVQITSRSDSQHQNLLFENNYIENSSSANSARAIMTDGIVSASVGPELIIRDNEMVASRYGVWLREVGGLTTIEGNSFTINQGTTLAAYGVFVEEMAGTSHTVIIRNNTIEDSRADGNDFYAVSAEAPADYKISGNTFRNLTADGTLFGVNIAAAGHYEISGNIFNGFTGNGGVEMISFLSNIVGDHTATISNNFLTGFASGGSGENLFGIIVRSPNFPAVVDVDIFHNTIVLNPITITGNGWDYRGISLFSNARISTVLRNNIIINADDNGSGILSYAYYQAGSAAAGFDSDFNLWYVVNPETASTWLSRHGAVGTNTTELSEHQSNTEADESSVSKNVEFVDSASGDLRLTGDSNGDPELAGTPLDQVKTDIDGKQRDPFKPYKGAWEGVTLSPSAVISGNAGFRMLALPVNNVPLTTLAGQNLIQGVAGTDAFYNDEGNYEAADPNFFTYQNTTSENAAEGWTIPSSIDNQIPSGEGFIWYFFDNDKFNSVPLPFNLFMNGDVTEGNVTRVQHNDVDFTLLGNPFNQPLPIENIDGNIQNNVQIWNPEANDGLGGYEVAETLINPFSGFFVENSGDGGNVTITEPSSLKSNAQTIESRIVLKLQGISQDGQIVTDYSTQMRFVEGATDGWDKYDLSKLHGFNHIFAAVAFLGEKNGQPNLQVIDSREKELQESIEVPLVFTSQNFSGDFEIWSNLENIPEHWKVHLLDTITGEVVNLRHGRLSFSYEQSTAAKNNSQILPNDAGMPLIESLSKNEKSIETRFILQVDPQPLSAPIGSELPQVMALSQNYPNPFNPITQIMYELPESAEVRLEVYNIQGQRVAVLVNGTRQAGMHTVQFDGTSLSSGMYIYRLQSNGNSITKKMMLIK